MNTNEPATSLYRANRMLTLHDGSRGRSPSRPYLPRPAWHVSSLLEGERPREPKVTSRNLRGAKCGTSPSVPSIAAMRTLACCCAALAALLAGCARQADSPPAPGGQVRVVSLSPNLTEIICAIGAADTLVGRSSACDYPPDAVKSVPIVGDFGVPSLEALARCKPDVVVSVDLDDKSMAKVIGQLGIRYQNLSCRTLDDIPRCVRTLGRLLRREPGAEKVAADLEKGLTAWRVRPVTAPAPAVFLEIWGDPLMTVGRQSFIAEMIRLAGGRNVSDDVDRDYVQISPEAVIARNPDVIILMDSPGTNATANIVSTRPGWAQITAVRSGRVYSGLDPNVIEKPGPRVLLAIEALHACLHPSSPP